MRIKKISPLLPAEPMKSQEGTAIPMKTVAKTKIVKA
jgi:hypothetical protein